MKIEKSSDPLLDAGVRGLVVNMAKKNFWRVANWYEIDDLIQDGYMCWAKVRQAYPKIKNIKHLTALFKTTFSRYIIDLSNKKREGEELVISQFIDERSNGIREWESLLGVTDEVGTASILLHSMPSELKELWRYLTSESGRAELRGRYQTVRGVRETTNQFLCRVLGLDSETVNLEAMAKQHFLSDSPVNSWEGFLCRTMKSEFSPDVSFSY